MKVFQLRKMIILGRDIMKVLDVEWKRMEARDMGDGFQGHITLDKLAIPDTVKVTLLGETIIPASFDFYGHPNFTEEQQMLYTFKEEEFRRKNGDKYAVLEAEIVYEEGIFDVPRSRFDTISGIENSLKNLFDLNEMLENRKLFCKANPKEPLREFVIFGCFWLDQFGQVMTIQKSGEEALRIGGEVESYDEFCQNNTKGFFITTGGYSVPAENAVCPCCGKHFTVDDIRNNPCVYKNGKYYHDSCWRDYRRHKEVYQFTHQLMSLVYQDADYQFELLPNGYWQGDSNSHIPWFLFHTIDGDIIMGWRKRVISIEWQKNYKPFDMKELFDAEDVTKWEEDGKRGIHAWGEDKAREYLQKVLEIVNPDYSVW